MFIIGPLYKEEDKVITVVRVIVQKKYEKDLPICMLIVNVDFKGEDNVRIFSNRLREFILLTFLAEVDIRIIGNIKNTNIPYNESF